MTTVSAGRFASFLVEQRRLGVHDSKELARRFAERWPGFTPMQAAKLAGDLADAVRRTGGPGAVAVADGMDAIDREVTLCSEGVNNQGPNTRRSRR